jgi:hypothetical protein
MRPTTTKCVWFDFYMIEAKPENLIGDRAYDSDPPSRQGCAGIARGAGEGLRSAGRPAAEVVPLTAIKGL